MLAVRNPEVQAAERTLTPKRLFTMTHTTMQGFLASLATIVPLPQTVSGSGRIIMHTSNHKRLKRDSGRVFSTLTHLAFFTFLAASLSS